MLDIPLIFEYNNVCQKTTNPTQLKGTYHEYKSHSFIKIEVP
jgi:hypothetical protein